MKRNWLHSKAEYCPSAKSINDFRSIVSIPSSSRASQLSRTGKNWTASDAFRSPGTGITDLPNSIRVPATPDNRSYLRLLRHAEESRWKATDVQVHEGTHDSKLPSAIDFGAEAWLMRIVGTISLVALAYATVDSIQLAKSWAGFVEWVKFAVGG
jgi:hypothetical protein